MTFKIEIAHLFIIRSHINPYFLGRKKSQFNFLPNNKTDRDWDPSAQKLPSLLLQFTHELNIFVVCVLLYKKKILYLGLDFAPRSLFDLNSTEC